jgi:hypothetical protein
MRLVEHMEEPNPIDNVGRGYRITRIFIFLFWILALSIAALPLGANQDAADAKVDYGMAQKDIFKLELAINDVINRDFSSSQFAIVQPAKGYYLPGYGINFSFQLNIHRAVISTPFGQIRTNPETLELKMQRIEDLKDKLIRVLQKSGDGVRQLRKDDNITIVAFIEDRNIPDEPNASKTIVMSSSKKDLDELGHKDERFKEFKQRMKIIEY